MLPKHIVLIEDHPEILEVVELLLTNAGYRVTALPSVTSLEALLTLDADCFILDEQLPYVSGHIICIYLRSKPLVANIPVLLISAHPKLNNYAELCDADAWITKPFENHQLLNTVADLVARRKS